MDHVWRIHVLFVFVCATTIYLTVASWTSTRDALPELERFVCALDAIRTNSTNVDEVARFQGGLFSKSRHALVTGIRSVDKSIEFGRGLEGSMRELTWIESLHGLESEELPFAEERDSLSHVTLELQRLGRLESSPGLKEWVADVRGKQLERVRLQALEPAGPTERGIVTVDLVATDRDGVLPKQQKSFRLEFRLIVEQAWSEGDFWSTFPNVEDWFERSQKLGATPSAAFTAAKGSLTHGLKEDLVLGPFRLRGEHLGFLGPGVVLLISIYIHLCARTLAARLLDLPPGVVEYIRTTSRWLSLRIAPEARAVAVLCDLGLASVAVGLPLWRLTSQPLGVAVVLALMSVLLGWSTLALFSDSNAGPYPNDSGESSADELGEHWLEVVDLPRPEPTDATTPVGADRAEERPETTKARERENQ